MTLLERLVLINQEIARATISDALYQVRRDYRAKRDVAERLRGAVLDSNEKLVECMHKELDALKRAVEGS